MLDFDYVGKYKIIDGHTHLYGPMYDKDPRVRKRSFLGVLTADELVAHMKRFGIDRFVTFPIHWNLSDIVYDPTYHIPNIQVSEAQKKYPDNIIGFGRVNPNYKGKPLSSPPVVTLSAEEEARRCFEELGLKGLKVQPEVEHISMSNTERWEPIMELLAKYKYPLLAHSYIHWSTDTPGRFYTLAETFPDVNIIMSHSSFRHSYDAMVVAKHNDNVYLGISEMGLGYITQAIDMGLEDRLVYESDTPFYLPNLIIGKVVYHPKLTEQQKIDILGGNLARILHIKL